MTANVPAAGRYAVTSAAPATGGFTPLLPRASATLILGESDQMTSPKTTAELAKALEARVLVVPAGHQLMAEAPEPVLNAMRTALS